MARQTHSGDHIHAAGDVPINWNRIAPGRVGRVAAAAVVLTASAIGYAFLDKGYPRADQPAGEPKTEQTPVTTGSAQTSGEQTPASTDQGTLPSDESAAGAQAEVQGAARRQYIKDNLCSQKWPVFWGFVEVTPPDADTYRINFPVVTSDYSFPGKVEVSHPYAAVGFYPDDSTQHAEPELDIFNHPGTTYKFFPQSVPAGTEDAFFHYTVAGQETALPFPNDMAFLDLCYAQNAAGQPIVQTLDGTQVGAFEKVPALPTSDNG